MMLAPSYVLWAFTAATLAGMTLGLWWLVYHGAAERVLRHAWAADGAVVWPLYAGLYHTLFFFWPPTAQVLANPSALLTLWGFLGLYLALRLAPWAGLRPARASVAALAAALAAWAFCIGAGYTYLDLLEGDATRLTAPAAPLPSPRGEDIAALRRVAALTRLRPAIQVRIRLLLAQLEAGAPPDPQQGALFRAMVVPELREGYRRALQKLRTHQTFQILLLAGVLLGWGFGRKPGG